MMVVAFLCTRVTRALMEDHQNLKRVLGYLKKMVSYMLQLKPCGLLQSEVYVDAASASHVHSKFQPGRVVFLGGDMVFKALQKQKCMAKSPTESKLVVLTDYTSFVQAFAKLFGFIVGEEARAPTITKTVSLSFHC
jgi:hypothetical protein